MLHERGFPDVLSGVEGFAAFFLGILALGCLMNWLREWCHDLHGRIFFTSLTALGLLVVAGLVFDLVRRHVGQYLRTGAREMTCNAGAWPIA